jgi:tRNA A58 N-methylase Trm61
MKDYIYQDDDGRVMYVAEMPTQDIVECLARGVEIIDHDDREAIAKRLQLELEIRRGGLR